MVHDNNFTINHIKLYIILQIKALKGFRDFDRTCANISMENNV
jgi:hypothetical protein